MVEPSAPLGRLVRPLPRVVQFDRALHAALHARVAVAELLVQQRIGVEDEPLGLGEPVLVDERASEQDLRGLRLVAARVVASRRRRPTPWWRY